MALANRCKLLAFLMFPLFPGCTTTPTDGGASGNCTAAGTLSIGTPVSGSLSTGDCKAEGKFEDNFTLNVATPTLVKVTVSAGSTSEFSIYRGGTQTDEALMVDQEFSGSRTFYVALPAGAHVAQIFSDKTGNYTIDMASSTAPSGCIGATTPVYVTRGSVVNGAITSTDCVNNSYYGDPYMIMMANNAGYAFTSTASVGINLELNRAGTVLAHMNNNNAGSVTLNHRATVTDNHNLAVVAIPQNAFGTYTLTVQ